MTDKNQPTTEEMLKAIVAEVGAMGIDLDVDGLEHALADSIIYGPRAGGLDVKGNDCRLVITAGTQDIIIGACKRQSLGYASELMLLLGELLAAARADFIKQQDVASKAAMN